MKGFKGFDKDMKCRGLQYETGKSYETDKAELCESGFHFCENPLDVLGFYPLIDGDGEMNRFGEVEAEGLVLSDGKKSVTTKIGIKVELGLKELVGASIKFLFEKTETEKASGYFSRLVASGDCSQLAASGDCSQLAASGDYSQLAASGDSSQLAASGDYSQLAASGYYSHLAASGDYSRLAASGDSSHLAASGENSVIANIGKYGKVKGLVGTWITLAEYDNGGKCKCVMSAKIDGKRLKAGIWYKLENKKIVEA